MNSYQKESALAPKSSYSKERSRQVAQLRDKRKERQKASNTQGAIDNSDRVVQQKEKTSSFSNAPIQRQENKTGLPDQLKTGIESLSGIDMSDTRVHYNSSQPAQLQAHAFAQGNNIHIAPGQEQHLAHEAWHVVQQKQGRVKATTQYKGKTPINDDASLEREADIMGAKAIQGGYESSGILKSMNGSGAVQRYSVDNGWKISDDRSFANYGKKWLYATDQQIDKSNKMLKLSGGKGSLITLGKGAAREIYNVNMKRVEPSLDANAVGRHSMGSHHRSLTAENTDEFKLWRDCERASEAVTGTEDNENRRTKIESSGSYHGLKVGGSRNNLKDDTAHSLTAQVYMFNLGPFLLTKANQNMLTYINFNMLEAEDHDGDNFTSTTNNPARALRIYNALKPTAKEEFDKFAKINDYALPDVGDSFVISSETEMPGYNQGQRAWQFHWGGVIFKGGNDVATLESTSSGTVTDIDDEWYFDIVGAKKQNGNINGKSFDRIHRETQLHGNKTTTIAVTHANTPKTARDFAQKDYPVLLNGWLVQMEEDETKFQNWKTNWDLNYTEYLRQANAFLTEQSRLKGFQKDVIREVKTELEALKVRRDALDNE